MYLWVVVPLEPSLLPNWAENSWEGHDSSLPSGDPLCSLGPPLECTCSWITQLRDGQDSLGTGIGISKHRESWEGILPWAGTPWYFYDKRSKGRIFPTFSHRRSLLPHPLKAATSRSQEEFLCCATKYLAKQLRSVQQIKSNVKKICFQKHLGRSNAFEHLGAGSFLNESPLSAKIWNRSYPVNSSSHICGTLK